MHQRLVFLLRHALDVHELAGDGLAQVGQHGLEQVEAFRLVLVERIALAVAAEVDHLAQMLERDEMLAPEVIEGLQQDHLLDLPHGLGRRTRPPCALAFSSIAFSSRSVISSSAMPSSAAQRSIGRSRPKMRLISSFSFAEFHCSA